MDNDKSYADSSQFGKNYASQRDISVTDQKPVLAYQQAGGSESRYNQNDFESSNIQNALTQRKKSKIFSHLGDLFGKNQNQDSDNKSSFNLFVNESEKSLDEDDDPSLFDHPVIPGFTKILELKEGTIFGELALIRRAGRAATIRSLNKSYMAVLQRNDFKVIQIHHQQRVDERINIIRQIPFLHDVSKVTLMKFSHYFVEKKFTRGQIVFNEMQSFNYLHMIKEGEFELNRSLEICTKKENERRQFDMREMLVHTQHKYPTAKFPRYVKSIEHFVKKPSFDAKGLFPVSRVFPYRVIGLDEFTQNSCCHFNTMKCTSQVGKTFQIHREHFNLILNLKKTNAQQKMTLIASNIGLLNLNRIEQRGRLKERFESINDQDQIMGIRSPKTNIDYNDENDCRLEGYEELTDQEKYNVFFNKKNEANLILKMKELQDNEIDQAKCEQKIFQEQTSISEALRPNKTKGIAQMNPYIQSIDQNSIQKQVKLITAHTRNYKLLDSKMSTDHIQNRSLLSYAPMNSLFSVQKSVSQLQPQQDTIIVNFGSQSSDQESRQINQQTNYIQDASFIETKSIKGSQIAAVTPSPPILKEAPRLPTLNNNQQKQSYLIQSIPYKQEDINSSPVHPISKTKSNTSLSQASVNNIQIEHLPSGLNLYNNTQRLNQTSGMVKNLGLNNFSHGQLSTGLNQKVKANTKYPIVINDQSKIEVKVQNQMLPRNQDYKSTLNLNSDKIQNDQSIVFNSKQILQNDFKRVSPFVTFVNSQKVERSQTQFDGTQRLTNQNSSQNMLLSRKNQFNEPYNDFQLNLEPSKQIKDVTSLSESRDNREPKICQIVTKRASNIQLESIALKLDKVQKITNYSSLIQKEKSKNSHVAKDQLQQSSEGEQSTRQNIDIQQYLTTSFDLMKQSIDDQQANDQYESLRSKEACSTQLLNNVSRQGKHREIISNNTTKQAVHFQQIQKRNQTLRHHVTQKNIQHQRYLSSQNIKPNNPEKFQQSSKYFKNSDQSVIQMESNQINSSKLQMEDANISTIQDPLYKQKNSIKAADFISIIDDFKNQEIKQFFSHFNIKRMKKSMKQRMPKLTNSNSHSHLLFGQQQNNKKVAILDHLKKFQNHHGQIPLGSDAIQSLGLSYIDGQLHSRQQPSVILKSLYQTNQGSMTEHSLESSDFRTNQQTIATVSFYGDQSVIQSTLQKPLIKLPQACQSLKRAPVVISKTHEQSKPIGANQSIHDTINPKFFESIISSQGDSHPYSRVSQGNKSSQNQAFSREKAVNNKTSSMQRKKPIHTRQSYSIDFKEMINKNQMP